jgi:hypothetical protein
MPGQLADASQFELSKLRIIKILRMNSLEQYIEPLTSYPAIAAINASLIKNTSGSIFFNNYSELYSTSDSTLQPAYPLNKLLALYINDPGFFNIVTSNAFMLAYSNAYNPVAWDDYTQNTVYTIRETTNSSGPFTSTWETSAGTTIKLESLQYFTNYAAAVELAGELASNYANSGYANFAVSTNPLLSTSPSSSSYLPFKCIVGEQDVTDNCSSYPTWTEASQRQTYLTLNVLADNIINLTNSAKIVATGATPDIINQATIGSIITPATGLANAFDVNYQNILNLAGGAEEFLPIYNSLNYDRAVTPEIYSSFHGINIKATPNTDNTINNINNNMQYLSTIISDSFIMALISKGIMSFYDANTDLASDMLIQQGALRSWILNIPLAQGYSTDTAWSESYGSVWFESFASSSTLASMLNNGTVSFNQLIQIEAAGSNGIYDSSATGFQNQLVNNPYAISIIKAGFPINGFCSGGACSTMATGVSVNGSNSGKPPAADEFGATDYDCLLNLEMVELLKSNAANLWVDKYTALSDIATYICT